MWVYLTWRPQIGDLKLVISTMCINNSCSSRFPYYERQWEPSRIQRFSDFPRTNSYTVTSQIRNQTTTGNYHMVDGLEELISYNAQWNRHHCILKAALICSLKPCNAVMLVFTNQFKTRSPSISSWIFIWNQSTVTRGFFTLEEVQTELQVLLPHQTPLEPPYMGLFKVLDRISDRVFTINVNRTPPAPAVKRLDQHSSIKQTSS